MATSDRTISKPIVNVLTKAQYQGIASPSADEFYLITDDAAVSAGTGVSVNSAGGETIVSLDSSYAITSSDITTGTDTTNKLVSAKTIADVLGAAGSVTDVQVGGTSILNNGVANIITNSTYNSSSNKIATMSDLPSAGTTASAVGTTSSGGSATTWSKSDHVHSISSSTITSALGYTPASGDTKVKLTSVTYNGEYPLVVGPTSITSGTAYEANYNASVTLNPDDKRLTLKAVKLVYNSDCSAVLSANGYFGDASNNIPTIKFTSAKANASGGSDYDVRLTGISTPVINNDAANKKYVDDTIAGLDSSVATTTGQAISAITITNGKISSSSKINVGEANLVTDVQINGTSILSSKVANLITNTAYNSSTNKIATMSDILDTKVTNTLATTTKYYVTGTTSSTTNTGTQSFDSGIYATTTAGQLNATTYLVNEKTRLEYNSTTNSLDFIFI